MSKVDGFGVSLMVVVSSVRLACNVLAMSSSVPQGAIAYRFCCMPFFILIVSKSLLLPIPLSVS